MIVEGVQVNLNMTFNEEREVVSTDKLNVLFFGSIHSTSEGLTHRISSTYSSDSDFEDDDGAVSICSGLFIKVKVRPPY